MSKLIPDFSTDAPEIQAAMKEFNEEHLAIVKGENNYKVRKHFLKKFNQ